MSKLYNATNIWVVMIILTIFTYSMGHFGYSGTTPVMLLLLTVLIKSTFIIRDFMGLRGVSLLWRAIMYGWLWIVTISIAVIYLISANN